MTILTQAPGLPYEPALSSFLAFTSQAGRGKYSPAVSSIQLDTATFPKNVVISEEWPSLTDTNIKSWASVQFNRYYGLATNPKVKLPATRVFDLAALSVSWDVTKVGDANAIVDFFVHKNKDWDTPHGEPAILEVMVFLNPSKSGRAWAESGTPIDDFGSWRVFLKYGMILCVVPAAASREVGSFDLRSTLMRAAEKKIITGFEWFDGLSLGMEAVSGKSSLTIRDFKVSYQARGIPAYA